MMMFEIEPASVVTIHNLPTYHNPNFKSIRQLDLKDFLVKEAIQVCSQGLPLVCQTGRIPHVNGQTRAGSEPGKGTLDPALHTSVAPVMK